MIAALTVVGCGAGATSSSGYGGPYYIGGDTAAILKAKADHKAAQFQEMNEKKWDSSQVAQLNSNLFVNSIRWNRDSSNAPEANQFQQYNYVVQGKENFVAVWDPREILVKVGPQTCHYTISQNNGTYSPQAGTASDQFGYLDGVGQLFADTVGAYPTYELNKASDLEKPAEENRPTTINCG